MTLSNFDWTDKDSVKWFIMLPTGHTGPYSLNQLQRLIEEETISREVKIWAEGLPGPVNLSEALARDDEPSPPFDLPPLPEDEIPPLPLPMDEEEDVVPPFEPSPVVQEVEEVQVEETETGPETEEEPVTPKSTVPRWAIYAGAGLVTVVLFLFLIVNQSERFDVSRLPKMAIALHERILRENSFDGWDKKIFFKEYLPDDHSHIWLVTSSYQKCDVEATFTSLKDKLLSESDEAVAFKTKGLLQDHLVEFSSFDFTSGSKIIPGLYEMDIRAHRCQWDGFIPKLMNGFSDPDHEYMARTRVVLFSRGAGEFNKILDKLVKKKLELARKEQGQNELFWQDLQQKFETLNAITLQIEQHLLDFLDENPAGFMKGLKPMVDKYTRSFGSFLTSFVVENENYFKNLNPEAKGASKKRNYELMVKLTSKRIGLETMKFIEEFQALKKNPTKADLNKFSERVKKAFVNIKTDINQKILQISEDRSL